MTENQPEHPVLTAAQAEAVRAQLAAARHTDPVPDGVVQRLDRVLNGLANESKPAPRLAPVTRISRHRRRQAAQLLVAAAAVVAVGFGFSQLVGGQSADDAMSSGSDSSFNRDDSGDTPASAAGTEGSQVTPESQPSERARNRDLLEGLPVIRPRHLRDDVLASSAQALAATDATKAQLAKACPVVDAAAVKQRAVAFEGSLATLVYRAPRGDVQRVDLYRCDPPGLVRSIVVPSP